MRHSQERASMGSHRPAPLKFGSFPVAVFNLRPISLGISIVA